jgi:hypothetical protein
MLSLSVPCYDSTFMVPGSNSLNIWYFVLATLYGGDIVAWDIETHDIVGFLSPQ